MPTVEELEAQNAALREELEEEKRRSAMEKNVWNSSLPSPSDNRERVQKRLSYEKAAVSALAGAQEDSSSVESSVAADLAAELERVKKENEELKASQESKEGGSESESESPAVAKKTAAKKTAASKQSFK